MQITVFCSVFSGEGTISLTEEQIQAVASGQLTEVDLQNLVTQNQLNVSELQATVSQGEVTTQEQNDGTIIQTINTDDRQVRFVKQEEKNRNDKTTPQIPVLYTPLKFLHCFFFQICIVINGFLD